MNVLTAIRRFLHRLAHWTGRNLVKVEFYQKDGRTHVGVRCSCGDLEKL